MSAYLNNQTRQLLNDRLNAEAELGYSADIATSSDPQAFYDYLEGKKDNTGMLEQRLNQAKQPQVLDIGGGASNAAIQKRADAKFYNPETEQAKRKLNYTQQTANMQGRAKSLAMSQYRLDNAAAGAEMHRIAQEQAQRNAVIGQVLGLTGMVVGAYLGGPAGAMAGAQVGQAAGQAATGGQSAGQSYNQHGNVA